jgi:iron complex transport system substrate-binding protein
VKRTLTAGLACVALLLAACGDDEDVAETGAAPTEAPASDAEAPARIVSLSPSGTEILFAVGAGDAVVAVDDQSDFPEGVPTTTLSGYEPNLEAILGFEPDLVVASDLPPDVVAGIEAADAEVLNLPAPAVLEEAYEQIQEVGAATGHPEEAAALVEQLEADIDEIVASVPERDAPPTYYHELDESLYSVTSETFIGQLYSLAGLASVADAADPDGEFGGYPQLSAELLVSGDPVVVFLADTECCQQDAATFAARPGFADLTAVREGHVVLLSDDVASRWGPRIVDLLRTIVDATTDIS